MTLTNETLDRWLEICDEASKFAGKVPPTITLEAMIKRFPEIAEFEDEFNPLSVKALIEELKTLRAENTKLRENLRANEKKDRDHYEFRIKILSEFCEKPKDTWTDQDRFNHTVCTSGVLGG